VQARRVLIAILLAAATITLIVLLRDLVTPVIISIFLAYLLAPLVEAIENRGLSRTWAVVIIFLGLTAVNSLAISLVWNNMVEQVQNILGGIKLDNKDHLVKDVQSKLRAAFPSMAQSNMLHEAAVKIVEFGEALASKSFAALSALGEAIIIPFLTFFILKDARNLKKNIVASIPNRYFEMSLSLIHKATLQLGRFIRGQLLDAAIVGVMAMIALTLLKLPYALFIGALAGMANLIPFLGPIVGGVPAIIISIVHTGGFAGVLPIIVAFAVIKLIDDVIVQPVVVSKSVELHPVTVIISIFAGGHVAGILGMIVAVPLVSIAKVTTSILYWGFTKYYIFGPPSFAVENLDEAEVEILPAMNKMELLAPSPAPSGAAPHPPATPPPVSSLTAQAKRARPAKKN